MTAHLLHGALGSPEDWKDLISLLGQTSVNPVDLYHGEILPFDQIASALCSEAQGGDALVGYSMGGRLAMHALTQPDAPWGKAVIISADPGSGRDETRIKRDASWASLARSDWEGFCEQWAGQPVFGGERFPWDRRGYSLERREAVARGFEEWTVGRQRDLRADLSDIEIPILFIAGERDEKFCRLATTIPKAHVLIVEDAGHRAPWEQPAAVGEAIRSFLS